MTDKINPNMRIWDALKATDPRHTKPVSFGARKFTSIDAHWQIQRMTEQFGPIGEGWGYEAEHSIASMDGVHMAVCDVRIWWQNGNPERIPCRFGPVRGMCEIYTVGKRLDDDAPKKCLTDALTKGLSHLGVSADVFLGLYDDNKYVARMKQEFGNAPLGAMSQGAADAQPNAEPQEDDVVAGFRRWAAGEKAKLGTMVARPDVLGWEKSNKAQLAKLWKADQAVWKDLEGAYTAALDRTAPQSH